jgi:hypothetical protein
MMQKTQHWYFFLIIISFVNLLLADVAPPIFPGYSLSLFRDQDLRMTSQKVDIYYDTVCRIKAEFKIVNPGKSALKKNIGFPSYIMNLIPSSGDLKDTTIQLYNFTFSLNGIRQKAADSQQDSKLEYGTILRTEKKNWYGWTCVFKPGLNTINLTYNTVPSPSRSGYGWAKCLQYIFYQSENSKESIDNVQVTIHFPDKIQAMQILKQTYPENYSITDSTISWQFLSLSPESHNNVVLEFFDFPQFKKLVSFTMKLSSPNVDNKTKFDAATFFATLVSPYQNCNQEFFKYIEQSERLFTEIVKSEPRNASFWKAYIENFNVFETDACSPCDYWTMYNSSCPESQKNIVSQAYNNCRYDSTIALWHHFLFTSRIPLADSIQIVDKNMDKSIDIKIKWTKGNWRIITLAQDTLAFIKKYYSVTNNQYLVRNKQKLDLETHNKLAEILKAHAYFGYLFCAELNEQQKLNK